MFNEILDEAGVDTHELFMNLLNNEEMFMIFMNKFLEDSNYEMLSKALQIGDYDNALAYAHALKGVAASLEMHELKRYLQSMVDDLRKREYGNLDSYFSKITKVYERICNAINLVNSGGSNE